ncbi:MAG TPA: hypothetical protein DCY93_00830 [Firmicutes bacterium]|nr:hypothetical protein [Bacillota bacterium]
MIKRKSILPLSLFTLLAASSCYVVKGLTFNIAAPLGAPSLALLPYGDDLKHVDIVNQTSTIKSAFLSDYYDVLIFDTFTGVRLIQMQGAKFKLARVLTLGNLFIASTGNDEDETIDDSDFIAGFGEGMMPDLIFKNIHPKLSVDTYLGSAALASSLLCSGSSEGKSIDYVVLSEPFIYNVQYNKDCKTYGSVKVVEDLKESFITYSEDKGLKLRGFPQAGLFISEKLENDKDKASLIKNFFKTIDSEMRSLERSGAKASLEELLNYGSIEEQKARFGLDYKTLEALSIKDKEVINKLAYNSFPVDLDAFGDYYSHILNITKIEESTYSKYYNSVEE